MILSKYLGSIPYAFMFVVQAYRLNRVSAELARKAADDVTKQTGMIQFMVIVITLGFPQ